MKLRELEIKIRLEGPEQVKQLLATCKNLYGSGTRIFQRDEYYDTPDEQLKKQDLVLRIRTIDNQRLICLKSPRIKLASGASERIELEFETVDANRVLAQLRKQGLRLRQAQEKERWTFVHHDTEILIDTLPFIGSFMEIEAPNEGEIQHILQELNLSQAQPIKQNYGELVSEKLREIGREELLTNVTFAAEKEPFANSP